MLLRPAKGHTSKKPGRGTHHHPPPQSVCEFKASRVPRNKRSQAPTLKTMDEFILPASSTSSITSAGDQPHLGTTSFLVEPGRSFSTTETAVEGESASASASVSGAPPGDAEEEAGLIVKTSVAHGSRPVSRFGFHRVSFSSLWCARLCFV